MDTASTHTTSSPTDLVKNIQDALQNASVGPEAALLAWKYAEAVSQVNQELEECISLIQEGARVEVYAKLRYRPRLLDTATNLNFPQFESWKNRCKQCGWSEPDEIRNGLAGLLDESFGEIDELKDWLLEEFLKKVGEGDSLGAYLIIKLLAEEYPEEESIQAQHTSLNAQLLQTAESELEQLKKEKKPTKTSTDVLWSYRSYGLEFSAKAGPIAKALEEEKVELERDALSKVGELVEHRPELAENWRTLETDYLKCRHYLAVNDMVAAVKGELQQAFEAFGNDLNDHRLQHDASFASRETVVDEAPTPLDSEPPSDRKSIKPLIFAGSGIAAVLVIGAIFFLGGSDDAKPQSAKPAKPAEVVEPAPVAEVETPPTPIAAGVESDVAQPETPASGIAVENVSGSQLQQTASPSKSEYETLADEMALIIEAGYSQEGDAKFQELWRQSEALKSSVSGPGSRSTVYRIAGMRAELDSMRQTRTVELKKEFEGLVSESERALAAALSAGEEDFPLAHEKATAAISRATEARASAISLLPNLSLSPLEAASAQLEQRDLKWQDFDSTRSRLSSARNALEYYQPLQRLHDLELLASDQQEAVQKVLDLSLDAEALRERLLLPEAVGTWTALESAALPASHHLELQAMEQVLLSRIARDSYLENVYTTEVTYFQGAEVPNSKRSMFVAGPVVKSEKKSADGSTANFKLREFTESGEPKAQQSSSTFMVRSNGSSWGFSYADSKLSPESEYYRNTVQPALERIMSGAPRFAALELIDTLNSADEISPLCRAYLKNQLLEVMRTNPWKWGLALSPSLQQQSEAMETLASSGISSKDWLVAERKGTPQDEWTSHFERSAASSVVEEARVFASVLEASTQGEFAVLGHVTASGELNSGSELVSGEPLWTIDSVAGDVVRWREDSRAAAFAPVFGFRFQGETAEGILESAGQDSPVDLTDPQHSMLLPPLLRGL